MRHPSINLDNDFKCKISHFIIEVTQTIIIYSIEVNLMCGIDIKFLMMQAKYRRSKFNEPTNNEPG